MLIRNLFKTIARSPFQIPSCFFSTANIKKNVLGYTQIEKIELLQKGYSDAQLNKLDLYISTLSQTNTNNDGYGMRPMSRPELIAFSLHGTKPDYKSIKDTNESINISTLYKKR